MKTITSTFVLIVIFLLSETTPCKAQLQNIKKQNKSLKKVNISLANSSHTQRYLSRSMSLPFFEGWDSGTFAAQGWHFDNGSDNWTVRAQIGNSEPSAEFTWDPMLQNNYSSTLVSDSLIADTLTEGEIYLDFDIKLDDRNSTSDEKILVEVFNDSIWVQVAEFLNNGSFDFVSKHIDITEYAMGHVFSVRFNATGQNSFDIQSWFIDNISIYRECASPFDLNGIIVWYGDDDYGALVSWEIYIPPTSQWFYYDDGTVEYVWGNDNTDWDVDIAIKIEPEDLINFEEGALTQYKAYVDARLMGNGTITVKVYQGEDPDPTVPIYEEDVTSQFVTGNDWNDFIFSQPVTFDNTQALWIGMQFTGTSGSFGPGITTDMGINHPNGDLKWLAGAWEHLVNYGIYNRAWLLRGYVNTIFGLKELPVNYNELHNSYKNTNKHVNQTEYDMPISFFNVYQRPFAGGDYELATTVDAEDYVTLYSYYKKWSTPDDEFCWKVTAVYTNEIDTCESEYAQAMNFNDSDSVCVIKIDVPIINSLELVNIYPNPTTNSITITSGSPITRVEITNLMGQVVYIDVEDKAVSINLDISSYKQGAYIVRITTETGVATKRLIVGK